jgi:hypothetical protein
LKRERWGSLLVQGKYREGKACDRRQPYRIVIIRRRRRRRRRRIFTLVYEFSCRQQ